MSIQDYFDQSCDDDIEIDEPSRLQPKATFAVGFTFQPEAVQKKLADYERLQRENERLRDALTEIEARLRGQVKPMVDALNKALHSDLLTDDEKRMAKEAYKWCVYASAVHAQVALSEYAKAEKGHDDE